MRVLLAFILATFLVPQARAQQQSATALPSEAQAAFEKGVLAAQQQDYALAIRYFDEARRAAPESPQVLFNLGLAESKLPGRELRAIGWFRAYLVADPKAANALAVKQEIKALEVGAEITMRKLAETARQVVAQIPRGSTDPILQNPDWSLAMKYLVEAQALSGDTAAAREMIALFSPQDKYSRFEYMCLIATAQAETGDVLGAELTATELPPEDKITSPCHALVAIVEAQLRGGDLTGAQRMVAGIPDASDRSWALTEIAEAQEKAGDNAGAKRTLSVALQTASQVSSPAIELLSPIAKALANAGDFVAAKQTATQIVAQANRCSALTDIAEAQERAGDNPGAKQTLSAASQAARQISSAFNRALCLSAIAKALAKAGDVAAAQQAAAQIADPRARNAALDHAAQALAETGNIAGARQTAAQIEDAGYRAGVEGVIYAVQENPKRSSSLAPREDAIKQMIAEWTRNRAFDFLSDEDATLFTDPQAFVSSLSAKKSPRDVVFALNNAVRDLATTLKELKDLHAKQEKQLAELNAKGSR